MNEIKQLTDLNRRAKVARKELGWTQEEAAGKAGVSREFIAKLETNPYVQPRKSLLDRVDRAYGKPSGWLLYGPRPVGGSEKIEEAARMMRALPDDKLDLVLHMLRALSK